MTALHLAVLLKKYEAIKILLAHKDIDVNAINEIFDTSFNSIKNKY